MTRAKGLVIAGITVMILLATLIPSGSAPPLPFSYALGGERRWLADGILNLLFFLPLGAAIAWNARRFWLAAIGGLLLSTAVEAAQTLIPGRDPALADILFNTAGAALGGLLGRRLSNWLSPDRRTASVLAWFAVTFSAATMIATLFLLSPVGPPSIGRSATEFYLEYPTRGTGLGFDKPVHWLRAGFPGDGAHGLAKVWRERNRWRIVLRSGEEVTVGPTVGDGWALLAYPDEIARRWYKSLDGLWMFLLYVPIGFYARRRQLAIAVLMTAALLIILPIGVGSIATPFGEWSGMLGGVAVGAAVSACFVRIQKERDALPRSLIDFLNRKFS